MLRVKLPPSGRLETEARRRDAERYGELFAEFGLAGAVTLPPRRRTAVASSTSTSSAWRTATR